MHDPWSWAAVAVPIFVFYVAAQISWAHPCAFTPCSSIPCTPVRVTGKNTVKELYFDGIQWINFAFRKYATHHATYHNCREHAAFWHTAKETDVKIDESPTSQSKCSVSVEEHKSLRHCKCWKEHATYTFLLTSTAVNRNRAAVLYLLCKIQKRL
jgi:hypothetical protein